LIRIDGPLTIWLGETIKIVDHFEIPSEEEARIRCKGCLLTHSFVNAHTHLPMILLRGLVTEKNFWDWLEEVQRLEECMKRRDVEAGYYLGLWENILSGNTTIYSRY